MLQESNDETRRRQLIQQIERIREKIKDFHQVELEIKNVGNLLKAEKQKKSRFNSQKTGEMLNKKNIATNNTNKKIKAYELKKKLDLKDKDYKGAHHLYLNSLTRHQHQLQSISNLNSNVQGQKQLSLDLDRLHGSLVFDINRKQQKLNEVRGLLSKEKQVLSLLQKEKIFKITQIKRLKKIVQRTTQKTQAGDMSISFNGEQNMAEQPNFTIDVLEKASPIYTPDALSQNRNRKQSDQILIQQEDYYAAQLTFKRERLKTIRQPIQNSLSLEQLGQKQKLYGKSYDRLQFEAFLLQENLTKELKQYDILLQSTSLITKGNRNLEASLKHSIVTLELLKNKLQSLVRCNQKERAQMIGGIDKTEELHSILREKQGQRGKIRGRLGIKVENTRMISILNEQINLDLQKVVSKLPRLRKLKVQCIQTIKRILGTKQGPSFNIGGHL